MLERRDDAHITSGPREARWITTSALLAGESGDWRLGTRGQIRHILLSNVTTRSRGLQMRMCVKNKTARVETGQLFKWIMGFTT